MLGLSKEVINKSRFCDWKTIIFFNYICDTNRLRLWSVFWYLMYSFMNLIYTRKVNLYQAWIVIFIKHFFHIMYFIHVRATSSTCTCISQMHQTLKYVFSCVGISPCYYVFIISTCEKKCLLYISSACFNVALVTESIPDQTVLIDI